MNNVFNFLKLLLLILFLPIAAFSMILEQSLNNRDAVDVLSGKNIGYYIGSFDPLHKAHEEIVTYLLNEKICDYILIYPSWGGDSYKKRTELGVRLEMIFSLFKDHPNVIVTKYNPKKLQDFFVNLEKRYVAADGLEKITFYGVIGSDTALKLTPDQPVSNLFMSGVDISKGYETHTWGGNIAIGVESFFVFKRNQDDLSELNGKIGERDIVEISIDDSNLSSTLIRGMIKKGESIEAFVDPKILEIINKHSLYQ